MTSMGMYLDSICLESNLSFYHLIFIFFKCFPRCIVFTQRFWHWEQLVRWYWIMMRKDDDDGQNARAAWQWAKRKAKCHEQSSRGLASSAISWRNIHSNGQCVSQYGEDTWASWNCFFPLCCRCLRIQLVADMKGFNCTIVPNNTMNKFISPCSDKEVLEIKDVFVMDSLSIQIATYSSVTLSVCTNQ